METSSLDHGGGSGTSVQTLAHCDYPLVVFLMELLGGLREWMDACVVYAAGTSAGSTLHPRQRETRVHT